MPFALPINGYVADFNISVVRLILHGNKIFESNYKKWLIF